MLVGQASSRTQIKETITEATTRIQLINTQAERRIQRVSAFVELHKAAPWVWL